MVVVVLGGTGSCGTFFVDHALNAGFTVRVLTRRPEGVTSDRFSWADHPNLELFQGDLSNIEALREICDGGDVVVSLAGPPAGVKTSVLPEGIRNTVSAMREHGLKRLIVQTGGFVKLKGEKDTILSRGAREAFALVMKEKATLAGNDAVALFLQDECADIDWTITRPGMLSDEGTQGVVEAANDYGPGMPGGTPSKIDLTRWYIGLLTDTRSFKKAPAPQYTSIDFGFAQERVNGQKRVAVITGANSGLGFETARVLLNKGMQVVCACRNEERGLKAVAQLLEQTKSRPEAQEDDVVFQQLDVSSLQSVLDFAQQYKDSKRPLHVLLCNAGIMMGPHRQSADGIDLQIATNYLGHFLLCKELQDTLTASAPARVVHVSSIAARMGSIDFDNMNPAEEGYNSLKVYQMSKLMQVVFSRELNERLSGTGVTSNSLEPGIVATNLSKGITDDPNMKRTIEQGVSVEEGAETHIFLSSSLQVSGKGGGNYQNSKDISVGMQKFRYILAAHSLRNSVGAHLWDASEELIAKHLQD